jgi:hypothetical protein
LAAGPQSAASNILTKWSGSYAANGFRDGVKSARWLLRFSQYITQPLSRPKDVSFTR